MSVPDLPDNLALLLAEFERSGLRELHLRSHSFELYLSSDADAPAVIGSRPQAAALKPARPVPAASVGGPAQAPVVPAGSIIVAAPNLGTFYRAPKPGAAPYVEIGEAVAIGDELCLIEVMKLFTVVNAEIAGTIVAILAQDGTMVEAGEPLFAIGPE